MVLQVHDEVICEVPTGQLHQWLPRMKAVMEDFQFDVPILSECKIGQAWGTMKKVIFDDNRAILPEEQEQYHNDKADALLAQRFAALGL